MLRHSSGHQGKAFEPETIMSRSSLSPCLSSCGLPPPLSGFRTQATTGTFPPTPICQSLSQSRLVLVVCRWPGCLLFSFACAHRSPSKFAFVQVVSSVSPPGTVTGMSARPIPSSSLSCGVCSSSPPVQRHMNCLVCDYSLTGNA